MAPINLFHKAYSPGQPRDERGRFAGVGEHLGRVAGLATSIYRAPHVYRAIHSTLVRRGLRLPGRVGVAALGAYGVVRVAGEAGGYVGRKIDEATSNLFKSTVEQTLHEFKHGELHSGSKKGPKVVDRKQAIAIALRQAGLSKDG